MTWDKLRRIKPEIKRLDEPGGRLDPRFHGIKTEVPVKWVANTRDNMALQDLYTHGPLKWPDTGKTCGNCVNFYPDSHLEKRGAGRCKAKGFCRVHSDWPAEDTKDWTDPVSGTWFKFWPKCPLWVGRDRLSKR